MSRTTAVTTPEYSDVHAETRSELGRTGDRTGDRAGDRTGEKYARDAFSLEEFASEGVLAVDLERVDVDADADLCVELAAVSARPATPRSPDLAGSVSASDLKAMSDEELLAGIRDQSEPHFAEIYNRYFQRIYSFVYTRMRNHAEAEEVVQETFLSVFRSFDRYRGQSSLLSWIYGIAKNTTNSSIRRSRSLNERIDLADDEDLMPRPSLDVGTPAEQLDLHRFRDQLTQRLESLADWQTEIFEMRHFENLSIPEISRRTTRSSDAVRSSLYRVKRLFFEAAEASGASGIVVGEQP